MTDKIIENAREIIRLQKQRTALIETLEQRLKKAEKGNKRKPVSVSLKRSEVSDCEEFPAFAAELDKRLNTYLLNGGVKRYVESKTYLHKHDAATRKEVKDQTFSLVEFDLSWPVRYANRYLGQHIGDRLIDEACVHILGALNQLSPKLGFPTFLGRAPHGARLYAIVPHHMGALKDAVQSATERIKMIDNHKFSKPAHIVASFCDVIRATDLQPQFEEMMAKELKLGHEDRKDKDGIKNMLLASLQAQCSVGNMRARLEFLAGYWERSDHRIHFLQRLPRAHHSTYLEVSEEMRKRNIKKLPLTNFYKLALKILIPHLKQEALERHMMSSNHTRHIYDMFALEAAKKGIEAELDAISNRKQRPRR